MVIIVTNAGSTRSNHHGMIAARDVIHCCRHALMQQGQFLHDLDRQPRAPAFYWQLDTSHMTDQLEYDAQTNLKELESF